MSSGGFGFVGASDDSEKFFAVTVELHLPDAAHTRHCCKRQRPSQRKFGKRAIGEYNICWHSIPSRDLESFIAQGAYQLELRGRERYIVGLADGHCFT